MSGSKGLIDKKVTELVSEIYNRVDGRGVLAGSALAEALEIADAALRRAKVEGMREAGKIARANAELLRPPSRQFELNMVNKAKSEEAGMIADEIDARAAQIEEGEDLK